MKTTLKLVTLVFLLLLPCTLILSGCSGTENLFQSHEHSFGEWSTVTAPTCSVAGQAQRSCTCGVTETQSVATLAHSFDLETHVCTECQAALPQIASVNDFLAYDGATDAVIFLDKCIDTSASSDKKVLEIGPVTNHLRLIGSPGTVYDLCIKTETTREKAMTVDLIDVTLKSSQDAPVIQSNSTLELSVCFFGTECGLIGKKGADGENAGLLSNFSMDGDDGANGQFAIQAAGAVRLLVEADQVELQGGDGGRGGSGQNAVVGQDGGDGGNGGNGAQAIEASSIDIYFGEGYTKESITIAGGYAGIGGAGGSKAFIASKNGSDGKTGEWGKPTNIEPTYH